MYSNIINCLNISLRSENRANETNLCGKFAEGNTSVSGKQKIILSPRPQTFLDERTDVTLHRFYLRTETKAQKKSG